MCKASGFPDIPTMVFKDAFRILIPQLVYMFILCFELGCFPDKWKKATIILLYKGGNRTEVSNYRPISLLPIPGKIIEKLAYAQMSGFLGNHNVLSGKQGVFRKGFSTARSVAELTDEYK